MCRKPFLVTVILSCLSLLSNRAAAEKQGSAEARSISAIIDGHANAVQEHRQKLRSATGEERKQLTLERPSVFDTAAALADAIAKNPTDPAVIDAAGWILNHAPEKNVLEVLVPALKKHHTRSEELSAFCLLAAREAGEAFADLMETIARENPNRQVKGTATYALGCILRDSDDPARRVRSEKVFAEVVKDFADVKLGDFSLARTADDALFKVQHLQVGKPAPEIEGEDADGKVFKLSDYRGKAVVVAFFGFW
ncbi:MAG: peroxiredoxin family protein [Verrucomicrobiales bacterium]